MATVDTAREETLGNPSDDFDSALARAEDGLATDEDRRRFLQAADFLNGLYDDGITLDQATAGAFDRDAVLQALQFESRDPRGQAETLADILCRLGEGYGTEEDEMTVTRSFFIHYEMLRRPPERGETVTGSPSGDTVS